MESSVITLQFLLLNRKSVSTPTEITTLVRSPFQNPGNSPMIPGFIHHSRFKSFFLS
jgi:hypothetical protein